MTSAIDVVMSQALGGNGPAAQFAHLQKQQLHSPVVPIRSQKSLLQTVAQPKFLIITGVALTAIGIGVAAYMFPATATAYAATIGNASQAAVVHTGNFLQPGIATTAIFMDLAFKAFILPAVQVSAPVLLPLISTALVATVATVAICYIALKLLVLLKNIIYRVLSAVLERIKDLPEAKFMMYAIEQILSFLKKDEDVDSKKGVVERGAFAALDKSSGGLLSLPSNLSKLFFQKTNTTKGE